MRLIALITLILLAACGRPLTENEQSFALLMHGPTLDAGAIRLGDRMAPEPLRSVPVRPQLACQDRIWPRPKGPVTRGTTSAMAIFQNVYFRDRWYRPDFLEGWPDTLPLAQAMLFAHEMVHVWQWQNRAVTGYHPLRAAWEHVGSPDPYQFDTATAAPFLSYGYEQQGAIMEELVCCLALDPEAPRTARLRAMLEPHFALPPEGQALSARVTLPWDGAEVEGICR